MPEMSSNMDSLHAILPMISNSESIQVVFFDYSKLNKGSSSLHLRAFYSAFYLDQSVTIGQVNIL